MILLDLVLMLSICITGFALGYLLEEVKDENCNNLKKRLGRTLKRQRYQVERNLDEILLLYRQGVFNEKQYYEQADKLIDELADILQNESTIG